jgi:glycosyltransferase involved in cell wall biosynthesis
VHVDLVGPVVAPEILRHLPSNVSHSETVTHYDLSALFARADAFVLPSVEDAFGLVVAEALASGVPVVATSAVGAAELVRGDDGTIIEPGDLGGLHRALEGVTALLPEERVGRADRFRSRVAAGDVHDWTSYAHAVIDGIHGRHLVRLERKGR